MAALQSCRSQFGSPFGGGLYSPAMWSSKLHQSFQFYTDQGPCSLQNCHSYFSCTSALLGTAQFTSGSGSVEVPNTARVRITHTSMGCSISPWFLTAFLFFSALFLLSFLLSFTLFPYLLLLCISPPLWNYSSLMLSPFSFWGASEESWLLAREQWCAKLCSRDKEETIPTAGCFLLYVFCSCEEVDVSQ